MKNIPEVKLGIVAVSRDCFPMSLSESRRIKVCQEYKKAYGVAIERGWKDSLFDCCENEEEEI